jgi:hypothetical protein
VGLSILSDGRLKEQEQIFWMFAAGGGVVNDGGIMFKNDVQGTAGCLTHNA